MTTRSTRLGGSHGGELRRRLVDHAALRAQGRLELEHALLLQHDEVRCLLQRALRARVGADVAVQVGAGQHDDQRPIGMRLGPRGDARRRLRRACSAISRSHGSPSQRCAMPMRQCFRSIRAQRAAVRQLPLLAAASAGLTIRTEGRWRAVACSTSRPRAWNRARMRSAGQGPSVARHDRRAQSYVALDRDLETALAAPR